MGKDFQITDPSKSPLPENCETYPSNDPFLSVFCQKRTILTDLLQNSSVKMSFDGHIHPSLIHFGCPLALTDFMRKIGISIRFSLSADELSDGDCYFGPFFVVCRQTFRWRLLF